MRPGMLLVGGLPHLLLSMACAEPMTVQEMLVRVEKRYGMQKAELPGAHGAAATLVRRGLLARAGEKKVAGPPAPLLTLTPAGEALLDELAPLLWERLGGVA